VIERPVALKMLRTDVYAPEQLADVRARFKKHTPPITYIRLQDPRRSRSATHA